MTRKKKLIIGVIIVVVIALAGGIWYAIQQNISQMKQALDTDAIYSGITIDGLDVGGMTKEDAYLFLNEKFSDEADNKKIVFKHNDEKWEFSYSDLGAKKDAQLAIDEAYNLARGEEGLRQRYKLYTQIQNNGANIAASVTYDEESIKKIIDNVDEMTFSLVKNSALHRENGVFLIENEVIGFKMNKDATETQVTALLNTYAQGEILIEGEEIQPKITAKDNEKVTDLLGSFSTKYTGGDSLGRNINLKVGSKNITDTVVAPGEIFSMNVELGPQTYENGYRNAAVIVNGKIEDGIAGGVCQITTTLYNAVIKAELDIVERKNHSLAVAYVPLGQDAAVAGNYKDFKFKNDTKYPVYIEAYARNGVLVTNVYGNDTRSTGRKIELEHVYNASIPKPAEKITQDPALPEGERIVTHEGKIGHKISTFKKVYENGELLSREWFSDSVYSPVADEITVGTGPKKEEANSGEVQTENVTDGNRAALPN